MAPLRIAILINEAEGFTGWENKLIAQLMAESSFELCAFLIRQPDAGGRTRFFEQLMRLEARIFPASAETEPPDVSGVPKIDLSSTEPAELEKLKLHVILNHSGRAADDAIAGAAQRGVWALDFNTGERDARALAGFWEAKQQDPLTYVYLLRSNPGAAPKIVARAAFNTKVAASFNAAFIKDKSIPLVLRELKRLAMGVSPTANAPASGGQKDVPSPFQIISYFAELGLRLFRRAVSALGERAGRRPGMWLLKTGRTAHSGAEAMLRFDPTDGVDIVPQGNRYWADPFLTRQDGADYIFFEDYDYRTRSGVISAGRMDGDQFTFLGEALRTDYHLSYPFLFEWEGGLYMMPETAEARRIEIWRCEKFPLQWSLCATALEGQSPADSAIVNKDGEWWLFTNLSTDGFGDHCSDLHVFRADSPMLGELTPHQLNPVVIDSETGRNGGRIMAVDGKILRPAQNNSHGVYGYGLNFMEIDELTLASYAERVVRRITPSFEAGVIGCHHFDQSGERWVVDVRREIGGRSR